MDTVELDEVTLAVRERGGGDGVPVVLLHGMTSRASTWDRFAEDLAARGRRTVAVDQRGHGDSSWPGRYTLRLMRDDLLAVLDRLGLDRIDLVGHSMGGAVALLVARERPGLVRRLVVEDSPPVGTLEPDESSMPVTEPAEPLPFDWRMIDPILTEFRTPDPAWRDGLSAITARTLLLWGGPASHVSLDALQQLAAEIPGCELETIEAGHRIHSLCPDLFSTAVLPFLDRP